MYRVSRAAAAMNKHLGAGDNLETARVMLADPRLVVVQPVEMDEQLQIALEGQRRIFTKCVERREKDARTQIAVVHGADLIIQ
jgi:hypothetical protein